MSMHAEATSSGHVRWERGRRRGEVYEATRRAIVLGQAVHDRRCALGLSQTELARRAGVTQTAVSRIEQADATPTITTLDRLAKALDADLVVALAPHAA